MSTSAYEVVPATESDATAIGLLHARSWQIAYEGILPAEFLGARVVDDRVALWLQRFRDGGAPGTFVIKAMRGHDLLGFACVLRDADVTWGPLLDNLHVRPDLKGQGIGTRLFDEVHRYAAAASTGSATLHLWVFEDNASARAFYAARGGEPVDRRTEVFHGRPVQEVRYVWREVAQPFRAARRE